MIINFFGAESYYLENAFFNFPNTLNIDVLSTGSTEVTLQNPDTGIVTTLSGSGFTFDANQDATGGTITGLTFTQGADQGADTIATFTDISWDAVGFASALDAIAQSNNWAPLGAMFNASGPVQFDASTADAPLYFQDYNDLLPYITNGISVIGSPNLDVIRGSIGNDVIDPGTSPRSDIIEASLGDDTINLGGVNASDEVILYYGPLSGAIRADIDTTLGSATVTGLGDAFTDTINGASTPMSGAGLTLIGTAHDDIFNITMGLGERLEIRTDRSNDTYTLNIGEGARLTLEFVGTSGVVADLSAGSISNNGQGGSGQITLSGPGGLEIDASDGADRIQGSDLDEFFLMRDGDDTVDGGAGDDWLYGELGNDSLSGGDGDDTLRGREGNDILIGGAGDDTLEGDDGNDTATGGVGRDRLDGGAGDDVLSGEDDADTLSGNEGNDHLSGGTGNDYMSGGDGNDTLNGGTGNDTLIGGETTDDLRDLIYGGDGDDYIEGGYGNDELNAGSGMDTVGGGFGADTIFGFDGNDVLTGEAWSDLIYGGEGNDFINGGFGYDRVNGGAEADRFYHLGIADHGSDWIQDYTAADGDVLLFGGGTATADDFVVHFAETAGAGQAGVAEAFVAYRPTGQVLWALIDGGGQAELNLMAGGQVFDLLA